MRVVAYKPDGTKQIVLEVQSLKNDAETSAEAEYKAVLAALEYLEGLVDKMGHPMPCKTTVYTASKFVVEQLNERADCKAMNLVEFRNTGWRSISKTGAVVEQASKELIKASLTQPV